MQYWTGIAHDEHVVHPSLPGIASRHVDECTAPSKPHKGRQERKAVEARPPQLNQYSHQV